MSDENPYAPPGADITVEDSTELAERGTRLGGAIIDGVIYGLVFWGAILALGLFDRIASQTENLAVLGQLLVLSIACFLVLNGYLLAKHGQTIGKRILDMRIVSVDDNKILPIWKLISLRYLPVWIVGYIPVVGPVLGLIDPLFIFREDRRCVHDLIAGTKVIKV